MKKLFILFLILFSVNAAAQKLPDMGIYKVRVITNDRNITAEIKPVKSEPSIVTNRVYNWYGSNQIKQTQGGYSGALLNGRYNEFYTNKNLKEQGSFDKGLKDGIWKEWTDEGVLIKLTTWQNGVKQGDFEIYNDQGIVKQRGIYKNGLLNGRQYTYNDKGLVEIAEYKQGVLIPKENRPSFWLRINIFKKSIMNSLN